jgi:hypothetical protein
MRDPPVIARVSQSYRKIKTISYKEIRIVLLQLVFFGQLHDGEEIDETCRMQGGTK